MPPQPLTGTRVRGLQELLRYSHRKIALILWSLQLNVSAAEARKVVCHTEEWPGLADPEGPACQNKERVVFYSNALTVVFLLSNSAGVRTPATASR